MTNKENETLGWHSLAEEAVQDEPEEERSWLTTFADLSLLLMVFFVLLFSMSTLDAKRFTDSFQSVKTALSGSKLDIGTTRISPDEAGALVDQVRIRRQIIESQRKVYADLQFYQNTKGLKGVVGAHFDNGFIVLRVPSEVLFAPGEVELRPEGVEALKELKDFFVKHPDQRINIRGFTDDIPPPSRSRFRDNWEISALRAVGALRYLLADGIRPERLTATGLADLEPLYPNSGPENRARNRRVEFVLEKRVGQ